MSDQNYASLYKRKAKKVGIIISISIITLAIILIAVGLILMIVAINKQEDPTPMIIVSTIMFALSIFDIILSIGFIKYTNHRIDNMKDKDAEARYRKIYGIKK